MKLIKEVTTQVEFLTETNADGKEVKYITGPFMEYDQKNRNGRIYPRAVMELAVRHYVDDKVNNKCAYGELNHPDGPNINLERACILINSLDVVPGGHVVGKARITDTPMGNIVRGLINSGANLGVSSRGLGSIKENRGLMEVQSDFRLVTASDVVADPSASSAYVRGVMENAEWVWNENTGEYVEACKKIIKKKNIRQIEEAKLHLFDEFLKSL